jgi:nucleoid DNA-binding protein
LPFGEARIKGVRIALEAIRNEEVRSMKASRNGSAPRAMTKVDLKKPVKVSAARKMRSKSEVYSVVAQHVGIHRRDVAAVFHTLASLIKADLKGGAGVFNVPSMMRITLKRRPATKARKGINPFTKEEVMFKAKPARNVVRIRPLKALKEGV